MFIGPEAPLAIIFEPLLRLPGPPVNMTHVICGLNEPDDVLKLFTNSRRCFRGLSTFEYFSRLALEIVLKKTALHEPLPEACKQYALIEIEHEDPNFTNTIEEFFAHAIEQKTILNATISQSSKQSTEFLNYREMIPEVLNSTFTLHKNDISLPISKIAEFLKAIESSVQSESPDFKFVIFGHIGDGNLHINILKPSSLETGKFYERCKEIDKKIYELVKLNKGSISAEHGIGLLKKEFLHFSRSETEVQIMRDIKKVLDPNCILNAGKIF